MDTIQAVVSVGEITSAVSTTVSIILWALALTFLAANLFWAAEMLTLPTRSSTDSIGRYGPDDIQVRVLTIGATDVVQKSVQAMPEELVDRHVIAEKPMDIDGATVHIVPDSFECEATRKGRALEWARRNVPCEKEYVLYIDEDSIISEVPEIPDADVIQFSERPTRTGSLFTYLAELFRMGFQLEQRSFSKMSIPLYAWGGGLAIRKDLEDRVTWNYETIIEDTIFIWAAAQLEDIDFRTVSTKFHNQAPPTITEMIKQRRRWIGGAVNDLDVLPRRYQALFMIRNFAWSLSPLVLILVVVPAVTNGPLINQHYLTVSLILTAFLYSWSILGLLYTGESVSTSISLLLLTPFVSLLHSAGALIGFVYPPQGFSTTKKIGSSDNSPGVSEKKVDETAD